MSTYVTLQRLNVTSLGRYRILRRIGRGNAGDVWLCYDPRLERQVAVKTLPIQRQQDGSFIQRFEREARIASTLAHPHILQVHDYGKQPLPSGETLPYIVMPFIEGGSLQERLASGQRIPPEEAFKLLRQAALAIDYAHQQRVIHRDIKPANMLLREGDWLLLADFGIARLFAPSQAGTASDLGAPEYMAPEQAQGQATTTSDVYSLAIIAYQLFTGQLPFESSTAMATMMQQVLEEPPLPREVNPTLPVAFEQILLQGLAKQPEARPALASDLIEQLEEAYTYPEHQYGGLRTLREIPALAFQDEAVADKQHRKRALPNRRQVLFGGAATAAFVAGGALAAWGWQRHLSTLPPGVPEPPPSSARPASSEPGTLALVLTGHNFAPYAMVWSPDSKTLVTASADTMVLSWDIAGLLRQPDRSDASPLYSGHHLQYANNDYLLAISPDGRKLAVANYLIADRKQLGLFTPQLEALGQPLAIDVENARYSGLTWISNDTLAMIRAFSNTSFKASLERDELCLLNAQSRHLQVLGTDNAQDLDSLLANGLSFSAKGGKMAILRQETFKVGTLHTAAGGASWQPETTVLPIPSTDISSVYDAAWTADGQTLVAYGGYDPGEVMYYSLSEKTPRARLLQMPGVLRKPGDGDDATVTCIACNPASSSPAVAVGTTGGEIWFWNLQEKSSPIGAPLTSKTMGARPLRALSWSPDGKWLAASYQDDNASILIWKVRG